MINKILICLTILFQLIVSSMVISTCLFLAFSVSMGMIDIFREGLNIGSIVGIWFCSMCAILGIITIGGGSIMCMIGLLIWIYGDKDWGIQKIIRDWIHEYKIRNNIY